MSTNSRRGHFLPLTEVNYHSLLWLLEVTSFEQQMDFLREWKWEVSFPNSSTRERLGLDKLEKAWSQRRTAHNDTQQ